MLAAYPAPSDIIATMSDAERKELGAFLSFFATFDLARPVTSPADLSDGAALFEVLSLVCVFN